MSTKANELTTSVKSPLPTDCPHWGKGGSYLRDPATGARTPTDANGKAIIATAPVTLPDSATKPVAAKSAGTNKDN